MSLRHLIILLAFFTPFVCIGQDVDSLERVRQDSLAITEADDFVTVSVCVASSGEAIYSALGHAFLRLQCPTYDLDYVYSYEAEDVTEDILRFFAGKLKMFVLAAPTKMYVEHYALEGRGVKEYTFNLPVRVKKRLWQQMDKRLAQSPVPYDYMNRGCAVSVLHWIEEAVVKDSLQYAPWPEKYNRSRKEMAWDGVSNEWVQAFASTFIAGEGDNLDVENTSKVMTPSELIEVLRGARAFGEPLLTDECNVLQQSENSIEPAKITPFMVSLVVLILSLINLRLHSVWLRYIVLVPCLLIGAFVFYLVVFSALPCTEWNWLIIPFFPLPFLFWRWRRWWTLPFATVCMVWIVGILIYPHQVVESSHLVLAAVMALCNIEIYTYKRKQI